MIEQNDTDTKIIVVAKYTLVLNYNLSSTKCFKQSSNTKRQTYLGLL